MKLTEERRPGLTLIDGYGDGGFRVAGERHAGSLLVAGEFFGPWNVALVEEISPESLSPLFAAVGEIEILLVGTGEAGCLLAAEVRAKLEARGTGVDVMATGAAARTYNLLALEDRRVGAALLAIP